MFPFVCSVKFTIWSWFAEAVRWLDWTYTISSFSCCSIERPFWSLCGSMEILALGSYTGNSITNVLISAQMNQRSITRSKWTFLSCIQYLQDLQYTALNWVWDTTSPGKTWKRPKNDWINVLLAHPCIYYMWFCNLFHGHKEYFYRTCTSMVLKLLISKIVHILMVQYGQLRYN